jgi:hypothetical protein
MTLSLQDVEVVECLAQSGVRDMNEVPFTPAKSEVVTEAAVLSATLLDVGPWVD